MSRDPKTSGWKMLGRSDGVLKPSGVRFGSSEIYNILLRFFPEELDDYICVGRRRPHIDDDEIVCLFVKMARGHKFDEDLVKRLKSVIAKELSRRHVPGLCAEVSGIPVTANGKKVEGVIRNIVNGTEGQGGKGVKKGAVANQECLNEYRAWAKQQNNE